MPTFGRDRRLAKPKELLPGCHPQPGRWADLGSGDGVFAEVLSLLLGPGSSLVALDRDLRTLARYQDLVSRKGSGLTTSFVQADLAQPLPLHGLDGAMMANVLHFFPDLVKRQILFSIHQILRPGGQFVLIEYNSDRGNHAVPYPLSATRLARLLESAGFARVQVAARTPSSFLQEMIAITGWIDQGLFRVERQEGGS